MSTIPRAIGIDLGTTNSVIAVMRSGEPKVVLNRQGEQLTPSAVGVRKGELLVGKQAKNQRSGGTVLSIKRFMGLPYKNDNVQKALEHVPYKVSEGPGGEVQVHFNGRAYSPPEISAMILHRLRQDASDRLGEPVGRAVITVPAYFNDAQVAATREAGRMAGFTVMRILREPTAAALAFGVDREAPADESADMASVLVYDLGGGTFDISIMMMMQGQFHVMGIEGNKFLGGDNFDEAIMRYIADSTPGGNALIDDLGARLQLKNIAEEAKKELSSVSEASISAPALVGGVSVDTELEREAFEQMLEGHVAETIELMHKAMEEAKVTADMVDHILLVGGSTLIPMVQDALRKEFGDKKIKKNIDPMLCVAFGAAMQTAIIDQIECPNPECHDENGQQTKNPLEATECERCHTSLVGFDTVICPTCFLPNDASQPVCRKCKARLDGKQDSVVKSMTHASRPGMDQTQFWRCWNCDFPKNPANAEKCQICGSDRERGGVKCPKCGHLNPPGRDTCEECGETIGSILVDVTPEDIGVELEDGSLAVLIPKNSVYPTPVPTPFARQFHTVEAGQRELEVVVRQGSFERAAQDEYLGMVLLDLPPDLPRAVEVTVSLSLDTDGTGISTVHLREYPNVRATARFLRVGTQSPETKRKHDELVQKAQVLIKNGEDLPEAKEFGGHARQMEEEGKDMPNEDWDRFEGEVARFEEVVKTNEDIKGNLNMAKLVLVGAKDFVSTTDKLELERLISAVETAIARGQMDQAREAAKDLEAFLNKKPGYMLLAQLEIARVNSMVSARLADRIGATMRALKVAQSEAEIERCFAELSGPIWKAVLDELGGRSPAGGRHKLQL